MRNFWVNVYNPDQTKKIKSKFRYAFWFFLVKQKNDIIAFNVFVVWLSKRRFKTLQQTGKTKLPTYKNYTNPEGIILL
jgi:hypothetical protein